MRCWRPILVVILVLVASPSLAEQGTYRDETLNNDIRELLAVTNATKLGDQMLDQIFTAYERLIPNVPTEVWQKTRERLRASDLMELVIPIYAKHFNSEDIRGIISFYKSPIGKKYIENQSVIMKESMAIGMAWGKEVANSIKKELKTKGYELPSSL
ncbi:MAG TPA: DUF2059 domain-containing protein [Candidatus Deferrimicrobiaceae bacterium]